MGTGASKSKESNVQVISPRVQMGGKKKQNNIVLDSATLSDVGSGTIRYRHEVPLDSVNDLPGKKDDIQTGYFYHPKLKDYSELGDPVNEEAHKFIRVIKGPNRVKNQSVMFASGIGFSGNAQEIPPSLISGEKSDGKKIYGHKYFTVSSEEDMNDEENFLDGIFASGKEIRVKMSESSKILDVKRKLSQHLLCPVGIIHLNLDDCTKEMDDGHMISHVMKGDKTDSDVIILKLVPN